MLLNLNTWTVMVTMSVIGEGPQKTLNDIIVLNSAKIYWMGLAGSKVTAILGSYTQFLNNSPFTFAYF